MRGMPYSKNCVCVCVCTRACFHPLTADTHTQLSEGQIRGGYSAQLSPCPALSTEPAPAEGWRVPPRKRCRAFKDVAFKGKTHMGMQQKWSLLTGFELLCVYLFAFG